MLLPACRLALTGLVALAPQPDRLVMNGAGRSKADDELLLVTQAELDEWLARPVDDDGVTGMDVLDGTMGAAVDNSDDDEDEDHLEETPIEEELDEEDEEVTDRMGTTEEEEEEAEEEDESD